MPLYDLSQDELKTYRPDVPEPEDFDAFWERTLTAARSAGGAVTLEPVDSGLALVDVFDVTFPGFDGQPVKAWLTVPAGARDPLPAVVEYCGYGGGRGLAHEHTLWALAGFAHLFMDTRGQGGASGAGGDTPDPVGSGPATPGFMTRGILDPEQYYVRRLITDAVRAVDAVRSLDVVDPARVTVTGVSQGGGLTLAVAGLVPDLLAAMADVPFLCEFPRAVDIASTGPYPEIRTYLSVHRDEVSRAFATLGYVDGVNFARRANAPLLASVAMMDTTCPPSTVFAAFNVYGRRGSTGAREKALKIYPYNNHEGGQGHQSARQLAWLRGRAGLGTTSR
ncbi:MAG: acetylxylan esterase [Cellulomonadaceae bacterium]